MAYGTVLFGGFWALGRAVRYRALRAALARADAERAAAEDPRTLAAAAVREERERLGAELVVVVRQGVAEMREGARRASVKLDTTDIAGVSARGAAAVTDMRRMLGLLREPTPDAPPGGSATPTEPAGVAGRAGNEAGTRLSWLDVGLGAAVGLLATADLVLVPEFSGFAGDLLTLWPVPLLAAAVMIRRRAPVASSVLLGIGILSSLLPGALNTFTVAWLIALTLLGWTAGILGRRSVWVAWGVTQIVTITFVSVTEPANAPILAVPVAAAATARAWSLREGEQEAHERRTHERQAELEAAACRARAEERRRLALGTARRDEPRPRRDGAAGGGG